MLKGKKILTLRSLHQSEFETPAQGQTNYKIVTGTFFGLAIQQRKKVCCLGRNLIGQHKNSALGWQKMTRTIRSTIKIALLNDRNWVGLQGWQ